MCGQLYHLVFSPLHRVQDDMDSNEPLLTNINRHCSLELVMLLITGKAVSNVFDNDIEIDSCLLKGVKKEVEIGLLSLFEHLNTCEVQSLNQFTNYGKRDAKIFSIKFNFHYSGRIIFEISKISSMVSKLRGPLHSTVFK